MAEDSMRGVNAAKSKICFLDGEKGVLAYYGYDVRDLVENVSFEETCYLLLHGNLPSKTQLEKFNKQLSKEREIPKEIISIISSFPKSANQLAALRTTNNELSLVDRDA